MVRTPNSGKVLVTCPTCKGSGTYVTYQRVKKNGKPTSKNAAQKKCPLCKGNKKIYATP